MHLPQALSAVAQGQMAQVRLAQLSPGVIGRCGCQLLGHSHRTGTTERVVGAAGAPERKKEKKRMTKGPTRIIVSRLRAGPDIATRALGWEVNEEEQSTPQPVVLF